MEEVCVLVGLETPSGVRNRPVKFSGDKSALLTSIRERFADILPSPLEAELVLQIRDDSWGKDVYVDLLDEPIPDRAVIRLLVEQKEKAPVSTNMFVYLNMTASVPFFKCRSLCHSLCLQ